MSASRPPGLLVGAWRVLLLSLRTQLFSKRIALPVLLLAVVPFLALTNPVTEHVQQVGEAALRFHAQWCGVYIRLVTLLVALLLATSAVGDELEGRTLVHFFCRPVSRASFYLGKYGWAVLTGWLGVALSAGLTYGILCFRIGGAPDMVYFVHFLAAELGAFAVYSALFLGFSLILPFPIVLGLIYGFGIEVAVAELPGWFARLSLQFHLLSLFEGLVLPERPGLEPLIQDGAVPPETAFYVLLGVTAALMLVGIAVMSVREFTGRLGKPS